MSPVTSNEFPHFENMNAAVKQQRARDNNEQIKKQKRYRKDSPLTDLTESLWLVTLLSSCHSCVRLITFFFFVSFSGFSNIFMVCDRFAKHKQHTTNEYTTNGFISLQVWFYLALPQMTNKMALMRTGYYNNYSIIAGSAFVSIDYLTSRSVQSPIDRVERSVFENFRHDAYDRLTTSNNNE